MNCKTPIVLTLSAFLIPGVAAEEKPSVVNKEAHGISSFSSWLPRCEVNTFLQADDTSLAPFTSWDGLVGICLGSLSGMTIDGDSSVLQNRRVVAILSGAREYSLVKKGPGAVTLCSGCVILVFEKDLGEVGNEYMLLRGKHSGVTRQLDGERVNEEHARLADGSLGTLYTSHPSGRVIAFSNSLALMTECIKQIKLDDKAASLYHEKSRFAKYLDPAERFSAVYVANPRDKDDEGFIATLRASGPLEIAWLIENKKGPLSPETVKDVGGLWQLAERDKTLLPDIVRNDKEVLILRHKLEKGKGVNLAMTLLRTRLGFVSAP